MNRQLLDLLVCPKHKKKLELAEPQIIHAINDKIKTKECHDIAGNLVEEPLEEALFQAQAKLLYAIRDDIPILIYEQAIDVSNL